MATDVQRIIDTILASPRAQESKLFEGRTFVDEPILRRGSQMESYLPDKIEKMRAMARIQPSRIRSDQQLFYEQARFMEDYEDSVESFSTFSHYFPTYESMGNRDLRRYFSWRAHARAGKVLPTSLSFVFVLFYELICGIGVSNPEDGFRKIESLWQEYRIFEPKIDRHARRWLRDYAAWHNLPTSFIAPYVDLDFDKAIVALGAFLSGWPEPAAGADVPGEDEALQALDTLSSYRLGSSRLFGDRPDTLRHVALATLAKLAIYYDKHRKSGLLDTLFGSPVARPYQMFGSAVFYAATPHQDAVYELDPVNRYVCRNGLWYRESYLETHERSSKLGAILRAVDQRLRDALGYEHPLVEKDVPKYLAKIIDEQAGARIEWERQREARMVRIDLSQLEGIRSAASVTREALLVDEERDELPGTAPEPVELPEPLQAEKDAPKAPADAPRQAENSADEQPNAAPAPSAAASEAHPYGLTDEEFALATALLQEDQPPVTATSLDMLVDAINEKLFDLLGDTAIEFGPDGPGIIEDYQQDVRGALLP